MMATGLMQMLEEHSVPGRGGSILSLPNSWRDLYGSPVSVCFVGCMRSQTILREEVRFLLEMIFRLLPFRYIPETLLGCGCYAKAYFHCLTSYICT